MAKTQKPTNDEAEEAKKASLTAGEGNNDGIGQQKENGAGLDGESPGASGDSDGAGSTWETASDNDGDQGDVAQGTGETPDESGVPGSDAESGDEGQGPESAEGDALAEVTPPDSLAAMAESDRERTASEAVVQIAQGTLASNVSEAMVLMIVENRRFHRGEGGRAIYDMRDGVNSLNCQFDEDRTFMTITETRGELTRTNADIQIDHLNRQIAELDSVIATANERKKEALEHINQLETGYRGRSAEALLREAVAAYRADKMESVTAALEAICEADGLTPTPMQIDDMRRRVGHIAAHEQQVGLAEERLAEATSARKPLVVKRNALAKTRGVSQVVVKVPLNDALEFDVFGIS